MPKHDEHAVVRRKCPDEQVAHRNGLRWIACVVAPVREPLDRRTRPPPPPQCMKGAVPGHAEEPGAWVLERLELGSPLDRDKHRLLQDVLGEGPVAHDLHQKLSELTLARLQKRIDVDAAWPGFDGVIGSHLPTFPQLRCP